MKQLFFKLGRALPSPDVHRAFPEKMGGTGKGKALWTKLSRVVTRTSYMPFLQ